MRKLNSKRGFTLIELLTVIVILALVLAVTIPNVVSSINNNKLSALNTLSKELAKWYDDTAISDKLATDKVLSNITENKWYCLNDVGGKNIADLYGLSENNIKISGDSSVVGYSIDNVGYKIEKYDMDHDDLCSAIKVVDGSAEVFLIGLPTGQYGKGNIYSYTKSTETTGRFAE